MLKLPNIVIESGNRLVKISSAVNDSNQASIFADRINTISYLKVFERKYNYPNAEVTAYIIPGDFTVEKLFDDIENLFDF
jgi:hypothetical protein